MALAAADRFGEGAFWRPTQRPDPYAYRGMRDASVLCPIRDEHSTPECLDVVIVASVRALLFGCRPAAISRLVMPIAVDAIKSATDRAWPHVYQEHREVVAPAFTHGDASPAVAGIGDVASLKAPLFRRSPCAVLPSANLAVCGVPLRHSISVDTPTTSRMAARQLVRVSHHDRSAAVAATLPACALTNRRKPSLNNQTAEPLPHKIGGGRHGFIIADLNHSES